MNRMGRNVMSEELKLKMDCLTEREKLYFMMMYPKSGVLYLKSEPGIAKSAIAKSIADKMGFKYKDIRLSLVDETDVGLYPSLTVDGDTKVLDYVVPRWALEANKYPTVIHFEELNRSSLQVRNAALQILLDRKIGSDFEFNSDVLMIASGNLGESDSTDVEEFDSALNNRLIHFEHSLTFPEWKRDFGAANIHSIIISFLKNYPQCMYQYSENCDAYATPRSWTFLSDFIVTNFGEDSSPSSFLETLMRVGYSYIGNTAEKFIKYCQNMSTLKIEDIIENFDNFKSEIINYNRDKVSELLMSLKSINLYELKSSEVANVIKFLDVLSKDELTSYLIFVLDSDIDDENINVKKILENYKDILTLIGNDFNI